MRVRLPRLPRLPVSRRRHEGVKRERESLREEAVTEARRAAYAEGRVAELGQAIREHRRRTREDGYQSDTDINLYVVLDDHDHQEPREDGTSRCYVCGSATWNAGRLIYLGGEDHWRHADCQPPKATEGGRR